MRRARLGALAGAMAAILAAGCSSASLPSLVSAGGPVEGGKSPEAGGGAPQSRAFETAFVVQGTAADIYGLVARGAFRCWLAPGGPLRRDYIFNAEAAPPASGGRAEIVLHERDPTLGDQRGPRAFRLAFEQSGGGVLVAVHNLRVPAAMAQAMARDAEDWAKAGAGCQAGKERLPVLVTNATGPRRTGSQISGRK